MACPAIITGDSFLSRVLTHIDCQAQVLGSYGYQALGQPGSTASLAMTGMLTLFIALFGIRLLFGPAPGARDVVFDVLKIGIVLALAFSWPAFRTLIYDVTLKAPAEIAAEIGAPSANGASFAQRLQDADNAIVRLTGMGTGRDTGVLLDSEAPGGNFREIALLDENSMGWARLAWLAGIIGSLALLRIAAGLLLAIAPLAAGLLLFEQTRGIFAGWLRGLVLAMTGSLGVTVVLGVELAVIGPWLDDALRLRALGYATPSAPTELFAMTLGFAIVQFGMIALLARVAWTRGWVSMPQPTFASSTILGERALPALHPAIDSYAGSRAQRISDNVETMVHREQAGDRERMSRRSFAPAARDTATPTATAEGSMPASPRLGSSWRRTAPRTSMAGRTRDSRR